MHHPVQIPFSQPSHVSMGQIPLTISRTGEDELSHRNEKGPATKQAPVPQGFVSFKFTKVVDAWSGHEVGTSCCFLGQLPEPIRRENCTGASLTMTKTKRVKLPRRETVLTTCFRSLVVHIRTQSRHAFQILETKEGTLPHASTRSCICIFCQSRIPTRPMAKLLSILASFYVCAQVRSYPLSVGHIILSG